MPDNIITRQEYNESLARIHDRIEKIQKTGDQIEVYSKMTQEAVDKMCNCIYGVDGREGVVSKITRLFERINLHTKLIIGIFGAIGTLAITIIQNFFTKK